MSYCFKIGFRTGGKGISSYFEYQNPISLVWELSEKGNRARADCPGFFEGSDADCHGRPGRGFALGSAIGSERMAVQCSENSDLLMLANDFDSPLKRYLKCMCSGYGLNTMSDLPNVNGDFNFYCYWRRQNYQLIPEDAPVATAR